MSLKMTGPKKKSTAKSNWSESKKKKSNSKVELERVRESPQLDSSAKKGNGFISLSRLRHTTNIGPKDWLVSMFGDASGKGIARELGHGQIESRACLSLNSKSDLFCRVSFLNTGHGDPQKPKQLVSLCVQLIAGLTNDP